MNGKVLGIDLGTTNSVVAVANGQEARVLADSDGRRLIPSVVSFHPDGSILVGHEARERRLVDAKNTVYSTKRLIGRPFTSSEVQKARERFAFDLEPTKVGGVQVRVRRGAFALPEISAMVLRHLRRIAEESLGEPCSRAVITVPANFNELQRSATQAAGKVAGLEVLRILNEPTAATLAYGLSRDTAEKVAVYDLGGGTFDLTVLDLDKDVFEVVSTAGDTFLGGDDLDLLIAEKMAESCLRQHRYDARVDSQSFERMRAAAEWAKCQLSAVHEVDVTLEELFHDANGKDVDFTFHMTRDELEKLIQPLIARTFDVVNDALRGAGRRPKEIDSVVLVGGSTRIPLVRRMVEEYFGRTARIDIDPDLVVAQGASIHGFTIAGERPAAAPAAKALARVPLKKISRAVEKIPRQPAFAPEEGRDDRAARFIDNDDGGVPRAPIGGVAGGTAPRPSPLSSKQPFPGRPFPDRPVPARADARTDGTSPFSTPGVEPRRPDNTSPFTTPSVERRDNTAPFSIAHEEPTARGAKTPFVSPEAPPTPPLQAPPLQAPPLPAKPIAPSPTQPGTGAATPVSATKPLSASIPGVGPLFEDDDGLAEEPTLVGRRPELDALLRTEAAERAKAAQHAAAPKAPPPPAHLAGDSPTAPLPNEPRRKGTLLGVTGDVADAVEAAAKRNAEAARQSAESADRSTAPLPMPEVSDRTPEPRSAPVALIRPVAVVGDVSARPLPPPPRVPERSVLDELDPADLEPSKPNIPAVTPGSVATRNPTLSGTKALDTDAPFDAPSRELPHPHAPASTFAATPEAGLDLPSSAFRIDDIDPELAETLREAEAALSQPLRGRPPNELGAGELPLPGAPPAAPPVAAASAFGDLELDAPPARPRRNAPATVPFHTQRGNAIAPPGPPAPPVPHGAPPGAPMPPPATSGSLPMPAFVPPMGLPVAPVAALAAAPQLAPRQPIVAMNGAAPLLMDVTPLSLGIETAGGFCQHLVVRNAPIPTEKTRMFSTARDDQDSVELKICQGESNRFGENQLLGTLLIGPLRRAKRGDVRIEITFMIDQNGILDVKATDLDAQRQQAIRIALRGGVDASEIEAMRQRQENLFQGS